MNSMTLIFKFKDFEDFKDFKDLPGEGGGLDKIKKNQQQPERANA